MALFASFAFGLALCGALSTEAFAQAGGNGTFACRASALRVANPFFERQVANGAGKPCADDGISLRTAVVPGVLSLGVLNARTDADPGGVAGGQAEASVADAVLTVGAHRIEANVLRARATSFCNAATHTPGFTGSSSVAQLTIDGSPPRNVGGPATIPLGPVTLYVNRQTVTGGVITQRALEVSAPGASQVVLAEAVAGAERCTEPKPPTAVLEVKVPFGRCGAFDDGLLACDGDAARNAWAHPFLPSLGYGIVRFLCGWPDDQACVDAVMPCGQKDNYSLCEVTYTYRGTSSTDPDDDIVSWTLDFGDGTSTSGNWATNPPTEVSHTFLDHHCPTCQRDPANLTVTDSSGFTHSDRQYVYHEYPD
jgi:hypothetical protein